MNSGMGNSEMDCDKITNGQPACLSPKPVMVGHGEASETERRLVCDEGLASQSMLKIQSGSHGNMRE